ncbi:mitochondrial carrier domain-containing protein [Chytriomyces sp. MP71]|nr:mitochondrial carrier domain-containing protein [Chytriomyces sp. MP71]
MSQKLSLVGEALTGSLSAVAANAVVFPLDVVAARLQVQSKALAALKQRDASGGEGKDRAYTSQLDALVRIAREEGIANGLFAGMAVSLTQTAASAFLYFLFYAFVRRAYVRVLDRRAGKIGMRPSTTAELTLGAIAGALSRAVTNPISVISTRLQTAASSTTAISVVKDVVDSDGILGLWRGFPASLILTVNPSITYGLFERVKGLILAHRAKHIGTTVAKVALGPTETFLVGAFTKALATIVTYPYILAKIRMQWRPPKSQNEEKSQISAESKMLQDAVNYKSAQDVLVKVFQTEGLIGWYAGLNAQLLKAVLCQGILFLTKDYFTALGLLLFK